MDMKNTVSLLNQGNPFVLPQLEQKEGGKKKEEKWLIHVYHWNQSTCDKNVIFELSWLPLASYSRSCSWTCLLPCLCLAARSVSICFHYQMLALMLRLDFPVSEGLVKDDHHARTLEDGVFCHLVAVRVHVIFVYRHRHTFYPCAPLHVCHVWRSAWLAGPNLARVVFPQMLEIVCDWWSLYARHTVENLGLIAPLRQASHYPVFEWLSASLKNAAPTYLVSPLRWTCPSSAKQLLGFFLRAAWHAHFGSPHVTEMVVGSHYISCGCLSKMCGWVPWAPRPVSTDPRTATANLASAFCIPLTLVSAGSQLYPSCPASSFFLSDRRLNTNLKMLKNQVFSTKIRMSSGWWRVARGDIGAKVPPLAASPDLWN